MKSSTWISLGVAGLIAHKTGANHVRQDVADVAALIEALDLGPVHLYGFSYGGLVAQAIALDHPSLVRTVVRLLSEPGPRNLELYQQSCGADVDFVLGGEIPRIPDFRQRLRELTVPALILAASYDRALYPALQQQFASFARGATFRMLERSGSFGHVEEPETVFQLVRGFHHSSASTRAAAMHARNDDLAR
jgi:pimeloyl-ACP methyl ester carboxylesterase